MPDEGSLFAILNVIYIKSNQQVFKGPHTSDKHRLVIQGLVTDIF